MNNIKNLKAYLSTTNITFVSDIPKEIEVNKKGKYYYQKVGYLDIEKIVYLIDNIPDEEVLMIIPFLTITQTIKDPYLNLSRQILITNKSEPLIVFSFLEWQIQKAVKDFEIKTLNFDLFFKYKRVEFSDKKFS